MPEPLTRVRSLLFVPATRPDRVAKAWRFAPDVVVVDLEDAVAAGDKEQARDSAVAAISELGAHQGPALLRVNPVGSPWFDADVAAAVTCPAAGVVVPKLSTTSQLQAVHRRLRELGRPQAMVVAGIETGLGVADSRALLAGGVHAAYFGAEDYVADLGGHRTPDGHEVLYARSRLRLAAHLAGVPAIDQAVVDLGDDDRFRRDAATAAALGYQGKICIHPRQVPLAHEAFTPGPDEVAHARAVLSAGRTGVAVVDGQMIDEVHLALARATLARAPDPAAEQP